jgi:hypothetical protein
MPEHLERILARQPGCWAEYTQCLRDCPVITVDGRHRPVKQVIDRRTAFDRAHTPSYPVAPKLTARPAPTRRIVADKPHEFAGKQSGLERAGPRHGGERAGFEARRTDELAKL